MKSGIELIAAERARQLSVEGWTPEHDDEHTRGQMAAAASCYAKLAQLLEIGKWDFETAAQHATLNWPWAPEWWKPARKAQRNLEKAGAFIAAEIDRLQRAELPTAVPRPPQADTGA